MKSETYAAISRQHKIFSKIIERARLQEEQQESRAVAREPRDAAAVVFGLSSPTTFTTSLRI